MSRPSAQRTEILFVGLDRSVGLPLVGREGIAAEVMMLASRDGAPVLPTTPAAFAAWYGGLTAAARPSALSPQLAALAGSLERKTERATLAAIHDQVRSSVRYVADERDQGAIVPRAPDLVVQRGYGDCKDRVFLAAALAAHHGIAVDAVLMSTEPVSGFDAAHVSLYNHMIGAWDSPEGETVYFDPTHRHVPFGALPESDVSASGLRLRGETTERVVVQAPRLGPLLDIAVTGTLNTLDEAHAEIVLRGELFAWVRSVSDGGRPVDVENALSEITSSALHKLSLSRFERVEIGSDSARFRARADLSEFVIASPTRRYLLQTPFRAVPADLARRADDDLPIQLGERTDARLVLTLDTDGFQADPTDVVMGGTGGGAFRASLVPTDSGVTIDYRFEQASRRFEGPARQAYLDLGLMYLDARTEMFIFRAPAP